MSRFCVSICVAPKSNAQADNVEIAQALKYGLQTHDHLGPPGVRIPWMRYPQYRNWSQLSS
jgi:hypothetical protein